MIAKKANAILFLIKYMKLWHYGLNCMYLIITQGSFCKCERGNSAGV